MGISDGFGGADRGAEKCIKNYCEKYTKFGKNLSKKTQLDGNGYFSI